MSLSASKRRRRMERDSKSRRRNEVIALPVLHENKFMQLEECLLPGIGNEVTLELIVTKLPWRTVHILSLVSPAWRQATQNRLVYDARVRAHSRDSFVILSDTQNFRERATAIFLYSLRNNTCYQLPPIPQVESGFRGGFPYDCDCIALDGKVYILGGSHKVGQFGSKDVYVLDLAGQRQWKPCSRMQEARADFECGAKDGKIYVFGGTNGKGWVLGSEVYDPSLDAWSALTPMGSLSLKNKPNVGRWSAIRHSKAVATAGEELLVYGGDSSLRGYYSVTNKWRTFSERFLLDGYRKEFMAQGKLHAMSRTNICVYDVDKNEWTVRHSCSFAAVPHWNLWPNSDLAVNELLAIVHRWTAEGFSTCLIRSKGFGSDDKEIVWEELPCSVSFGDVKLSMCHLKL